MELTKSQIDTIELLFDGQLTDIAIATRVGIDVRTLRRWQEIPEFRYELATLHEQYQKRVRERSMFVRERRLGEKLDRYAALNRVIRQRADGGDPNVPGDCTGLILKRIINTKSGVLIETRIDHATLRELSRLENEITREIGEVLPDAVIEERKLLQELSESNPEETAPAQQNCNNFNRAARRRAHKQKSRQVGLSARGLGVPARGPVNQDVSTLVGAAGEDAG